MKVLFICDGYYPTPQASANCTRNIVLQLANNYNIQCDVLNITTQVDIPAQHFDGVSVIFSLTDYHNVSVYDLKHAKMPLWKRLKIVICKASEHLFRCKLKRQKYNSIERKLDEIGSQYDVLIPVVSDFNNGYGAMRYSQKSRLPYILYQVDPICSNETQKKYSKKLSAFEKQLYASASQVFTTPIIKKEKAEDNAYEKNKIVSVEFPIVVNTESINNFRHSGIVCFFAGNICKGVRDCQYTLKLFELMQDNQIFLEFVGAGQENIIDMYAKSSLKGQIIHRGKLSKDECMKYMRQSDFLINIGNIMTNQVPSKVFDYISTGFPIINVCVNKDCPTIPYMNQYGFAINLFETDDMFEMKCQAEKLRQFIHTNAGKKKLFAEVSTIFVENTPEYVGEQFMTALKKITGDG